MDDPIPGFTVEEFAQVVSGVMFEIRNALCASVGYGELALEKLDRSHPAFEYVTQAHKMAKRSYDAAQNFSREVHRRRLAQDQIKARLEGDC
jgi:hypothetical protein